MSNILDHRGNPIATDSAPKKRATINSHIEGLKATASAPLYLTLPLMLTKP